MRRGLLWAVVATAVPLAACVLSTDLSDLATRDARDDPSVPDASATEDAATLPDGRRITVDAGVYTDAAADAGAMGLDIGLVGYFPLNEGTGTTVSDVSGSGAMGSFVGTPSWVDGKFGKAVLFEGASYVDTPASDTYEFGDGPFTVAAWVMVSTTNAGAAVDAVFVSHGIAGECCAAAGYPGFLLGTRGGFTQIRIEDEADGLHVLAAGSAPPPRGEWVHLTGVRGTSALSFFVNGAKISETPVPPGYSVNKGGGTLKLGARGGFPAGAYFAGRLDEVRIYNRALSRAEIDSLFRLVP